MTIHDTAAAATPAQHCAPILEARDIVVSFGHIHAVRGASMHVDGAEIDKRVRNAADVPDMLQEVYLRMLRVPNVESIRSPEAYLFTVAQHVVQQHSLRQSAAPPSIHD